MSHMVSDLLLLIKAQEPVTPSEANRLLVGEQLREGKLIEVLKDYRSDPIGIYAVYPSRRHLSAKIRSFVDYLANHLKMTAD